MTTSSIPIPMAALIAIGSLVFVLFGVSSITFARVRTAFALLQLIGSVLLIVVVFAHIAEQFRMLPAMGWGRAGSAGHYLDLVSAVVGPVLYLFGYLSRKLRRC